MECTINKSTHQAKVIWQLNSDFTIFQGEQKLNQPEQWKTGLNEHSNRRDLENRAIYLDVGQLQGYIFSFLDRP